ncbi:glycosyltransferase family 25 protein [Pasteurella multocida]|uniref:glycosyltransferase family 25 protein n=1 Tax=Pasteurella multocida TaxID=747 RepID=UPI00292CAEDE|nr:glycosyltransferase family 25 protein [Pasteurella multocida]
MSGEHYVISLSSAVERRQHIRNQFSQKNIPFQFFDAVSPSPLLDQLVLQFFPRLAESSLTGGEKACFISHLSLWYKCVKENLPYIVVFEDDIVLGKDADKFLIGDEWFFSRFDPEEIFIIRLETFLQKVVCEPTHIAPYTHRNFLSLKSTHFGTAGYIISQGAAKFLLSYFNKLHIEEIYPIDEFIFNKFLKRRDFIVYQLSPAICIQELQLNKNTPELPSQLEYERSKVRKCEEIKNPNKTFLKKITYILKKPKRILDRRTKMVEAKKKEELLNIIEFR